MGNLGGEGGFVGYVSGRISGEWECDGRCWGLHRWSRGSGAGTSPGHDLLRKDSGRDVWSHGSLGSRQRGRQPCPNICRGLTFSGLYMIEVERFFLDYLIFRCIVSFHECVQV